jgi:hypothetical protein
MWWKKFSYPFTFIFLTPGGNEVFFSVSAPRKDLVKRGTFLVHVRYFVSLVWMVLRFLC